MRLARVEVVDRTIARFWARRGAVTTRTLRLTGAAVAAYLAALLILDDPRPVLAPLTALLVVQVTLVGTVADSLRRILSVIAGVAVAVGFSAFVGFSWWSLALIIAVSLLVGQFLRLGTHQLEVPISAMLVLAVGGSETAATDRISATIVGAAVGLAVNVVFPPAIQSQSAGAAVDEYATEVAGLLEQVAEAMPGPITREQMNSWLDEAQYLTYQVPRLEAVLDELDASRRLNRRAIDNITTAPGLRSGLHALEHTALALRALYRLLADVQTNPPGTGVLNDSDVRAAFGTLLHDVAKAIRDFGALVRAEADDEGAAPGETPAALDSAGEARARLTELLLVDPRTDPEQWQLAGALLTATDRALRELDLDERERLREAQRELLTGGETLRTAVSPDRLLQATRSATQTVTDAVVDAVAEVPRRRGATGFVAATRIDRAQRLRWRTPWHGPTRRRRGRLASTSVRTRPEQPGHHRTSKGSNSAEPGEMAMDDAFRRLRGYARDTDALLARGGTRRRRSARGSQPRPRRTAGGRVCSAARRQLGRHAHRPES